MTDVPLTWNETLEDSSKWQDFKRPDLAAGAAQWGRDEVTGAVRRIMYICPCGCQEWRCISVSNASPPPKHHWHWDGNEATPTLSPSILHVANKEDDCSWHGHLVAGVWKGC